MLSYTNQKGQEVVIVEMSDNYLHNSLHFFKKQLKKAEDLENEALSFPPPQGEMASLEYDRGMSELAGQVSYLKDLVESLQAEYDKRYKKTK